MITRNSGLFYVIFDILIIISMVLRPRPLGISVQKLDLPLPSLLLFYHSCVLLNHCLCVFCTKKLIGNRLQVTYKLFCVYSLQIYFQTLFLHKQQKCPILGLIFVHFYLHKCKHQIKKVSNYPLIIGHLVCQFVNF